MDLPSLFCPLMNGSEIDTIIQAGQKSGHLGSHINNSILQHLLFFKYYMRSLSA